MKGSKKLRPGAWVAVPLSNDAGYAVGLVARADNFGAILLGYFYGPRRTYLPEIDEVRHYRPGDAVLIARFGLGKAHWPLLGDRPGWDPTEWPIPTFGRIVDPLGIGMRMEYPDHDPSAPPKETRISMEAAEELPTDAFLGTRCR